MAIISVDGNPVPPSEMVARVKQIHPRLGIRFMDMSYHGEGQKYWAVTMDWDNNDKRMRQVAEGKMSPDSAFDILGYLPLDCSIDEAYGYLVNNFKARPLLAGRLLDWVHKYNAGVESAVMEPVNAHAEEVIEKSAMELAKKTGGSLGKFFITDRRTAKKGS